MDIKIHKTIRLKAKVIELEVSNFLIFLVVCTAAVLLLINSFSVTLMIFEGIIVGIIYVLLLFFQGSNASDILSKMPKLIVNK